MESNVNYIEIVKSSQLEKRLRECAELYCKIWKEPPWLEDFWDVKVVISDMRQQLKKRGSVFVFAKSENNIIIGFSWGYIVSLPEMREICGNDKLDHLFKGEMEVFYIDELGVDKSYRNQGIGKHLTRELVELASGNGSSVAILRTNINAEAAKTVYREVGFSDTAIYDEKYQDRNYWIKKL